MLPEFTGYHFTNFKDGGSNQNGRQFSFGIKSVNFTNRIMNCETIKIIKNMILKNGVYFQNGLLQVTEISSIFNRFRYLTGKGNVLTFSFIQN
jgi:hypothetical protein